MRPRTYTQTDAHRCVWPQYILRRLRLTQNVITIYTFISRYEGVKMCLWSHYHCQHTGTSWLEIKTRTGVHLRSAQSNSASYRQQVVKCHFKFWKQGLYCIGITHVTWHSIDCTDALPIMKDVPLEQWKAGNNSRLPIHFTLSFLRLRFGFYWALCMFINYTYLHTLL